MTLKMIEPTKHSKTGIFRVRLTIPAELREAAERLFGIKREMIINLKTKDRREAIKRAPPAVAALQAKMEAIRTAAEAEQNGRPLTERHVRALAGQVYQEMIDRHRDNPGLTDWSATQSFYEGHALLDPITGEGEYTPDDDDLADAERMLVSKGLAVDKPTIAALAQEVWRAKISAAVTLERMAGGDYSDDGTSRFPPLPAAPAPPRPGPSLPLTELVQLWGADNGLSATGSTVSRALYERENTVKRFAAFLGHGDAAKITRTDAVAWKEAMTKAGKKASTIGNDVSCMSALFKWAVVHGKLAENVFAGLLPPRKVRMKKMKRLPYTDDQMVQVLTAARDEKGFLRFAPWLLALTGASLSEVAQARAADVIEINGNPFLRIHDDEGQVTGEARSVKNAASVRTVPLHPALTAEGFLAHAKALPAGSPLWPDLPPDKKYGDRGVRAQRRLSPWVRETLGITDLQLAPAHSFRHWFVDACRRAGMSDATRDALTGHSDTRNESANYGYGLRAMPEILTAAIALVKLPEGL